MNHHCEKYDDRGEFAVDDTTGSQLPPDLVRTAWQEEMHRMLSHTVKTAKAYEEIEKGPSVRSGLTSISLTVWARCRSGQGVSQGTSRRKVRRTGRTYSLRPAIGVDEVHAFLAGAQLCHAK